MMKIVQITWEDSCFMHGWHQKEELKDFIEASEPIDSVGFLIADTEKFYVLSQSFGRSVGDSIKIPKFAVTDIEIIKEVEFEINLND